MSMLYMFQAVSLPIIRSSKTVYTASGVCQACLLLPLARVSWNFQITHVNALHVSGGFSAHHQELKNCTHSIGYMSSLLAVTASEG